MTTKSFKEIPLADGLPILGNALKLTSRDFHRDLYAIARELGGIFRVTAPGKTIVVVSDPNILQEMVKDENVNFTKPKDLYKTFAEDEVLACTVALALRSKSSICWHAPHLAVLYTCHSYDSQNRRAVLYQREARGVPSASHLQHPPVGHHQEGL